MSIRWVLFFAICFLSLTLLGRLSEGQWYQNEDIESITVLTTVESPDRADYETGVVGWLNYQWDRGSTYIENAGHVTAPMQAFMQFITFDYPCYTGGWALVKVLGWAFGIAFIYGLVKLARGTS